MKKFTKLIAFALVLAMSVVMFASCSKEGDVFTEYENAKQYLKDAGYVVESNSGEWPLQLADLEGMISAYKIKEGTENDKNPQASDGVMVYYFKSEKAATRAWEKSIKADYESAVKRFKTSNKKAVEEGDMIVVNKSADGKIICYGTRNAVDLVFNTYSFTECDGGYEISSAQPTLATSYIFKAYKGVAVVKIGDFSACADLEVVVIPATVTEIAPGAFDGCDLDKIYYEGTKAQWAEITMDSDDRKDLTDICYYYSSTATSGDYWCYVEGEPEEV